MKVKILEFCTDAHTHAHTHLTQFKASLFHLDKEKVILRDKSKNQERAASERTGAAGESNDVLFSKC